MRPRSSTLRQTLKSVRHLFASLLLLFGMLFVSAPAISRADALPTGDHIWLYGTPNVDVTSTYVVVGSNQYVTVNGAQILITLNVSRGTVSDGGANVIGYLTDTGP